MTLTTVRQLSRFHFVGLIIISFLFTDTALAAPRNISFQSRIYKPDGTPLESNNVQFKFSLMNPLSTCVLYSETFSNVDMTSSAGSIVLALGNGTRSYPVAGAMKWFDAFDNATSSYTCQSSGTFSPSLIDQRRLVMQFNDGTGWQTLPPMDINSVPYAMFAENAETVPAAGITQSGATVGQVLKWNGTSWAASTDETAVSGGGVASVSSANNYITVTNGSTTPVITLNIGSAVDTVAAGNDSRIVGAFQAATTLSGDLTGTLPNPTIAAGAVTNAKIASVAWSKVTSTPTTVAGYNISDALTTSATFSGDVSGTSNSLLLNTIGAGGTGYKVTYDTKGRVTGTSGLVSSDITAALGFTPTPSQWVTNASNDVTYSTGNVGIGTTSARFPLHIAFSSSSTAATADASSIGIQNIDHTINNWANIKFASENLSGTTFGGAAVAAQFTNKTAGSEAADLVFITRNGPVFTKNMTIKSTNRIGIGTTNPGYALDVSGDVNVTGNFKINGVDLGAGGVVASVTAAATANNPITVGGSASAPTIDLAKASVSANGYLASSDFSNFNSKLTSTLTSANIFVGNGSNLAEARVLSGDASISNLGILTVNNVAWNKVSGKPTTVTGYGITDALTTSTVHSGDVTGTYNALALASIGAGGTGYKVTYDTKGRVTGTSGLVSADITTALGFTPTVSQWATNASNDISYSIGKVGIGISAPTANLHMYQSSADVSVKIQTGSVSQMAYTEVGNTADGNFMQNIVYGSGVSGTRFGLNKANLVGSIGSGTNVVYGNAAAGPVQFISSSVERMRIDSNGRIGIGKTIPSYTLDVSGDVNVTGNFKINGVDLGAGGVVASVTAAATPGNPISIGGTTSAPTIDLAKASVSANGYLASSDFSNFNSKMTSALTSAQIFIGNGSNLAEARVLSGDASISNLGILTVNNVAWNKISATPTTVTGYGITDALTTSTVHSGDVTGTYNALALAPIGAGGTGYKVTYDTKGRVTGTSGLVSSDITTALGFTPTISYWVRNSPSSDISYSAGNVGIGIANPATALHISNTTYSGSRIVVERNDGGSNIAAFTLNPYGSTTNGVARLAIGVGNTMADATSRMTITASGDVGIGTTTPYSPLEVVGTNFNQRIVNTLYGSGDASAAGFIGRKARGTIGSPLPVLSGDGLAMIGGRGYHSGGAFGTSTVGSININAAENFTATAQGTYININTTAIGANVSSERMRIDSTGRVGIGTTNPGYTLDVSGDVNVAGNFKINGVNVGAGSVTSVAAAATAGNPISIGGTGSAPTVDIAKASVSASGYLSSSDFSLFNSKISAALLSGNIFVGNGSNLAEGRVLSGDATLSNLGILSFNNTATARSNLGLGTAAVYAVPVTGDAGPTQVVKGDDSRLIDSRIPMGAASGDLAGTYPNPSLATIGAGGTGIKVTYDTKGRVISSVGLASSDVTTALGFTPTVSQWVTNASSDISYASGKVGIGITTPLAPLVVIGARQSVLVKNTMATFDNQSFGIDVGAGIGMGGATDAGGTLAHFALIAGRKETAASGDSAGYFAVETRPTAGGSLTERMRVTSAGNVGIGTTAPSTKLEISGTSTAGTSGFTNVSEFTGNGLRIKGSGSSSTDAITYQSGLSGGGAAIGFGRGTNWDTFMTFSTNPATGATGGAFVERMRIDANGNVGIGTTTPAARLDISGVTNNWTINMWKKPLKLESAGAIQFSRSTNASFGMGSTLNAGIDKFYIFSTASDDSSSAANYRFVIDSTTGFIGMGGITAPAYTLDVSGDVNVTGAFKVNGTNVVSSSLTSGRIFIGNASNIAQSQVLSGDATISNDGTLSLKAIGAGGTGAKVTYDTKGRVTGTSALVSSDITTALTFTPMTTALTSANIYVGNGSAIAQARALSGDATLSNTGVLTLNTVTASKGGTGNSTYAVGDILYASSTTALTRLPASTSGYFLKTNGAGTAPTWAAPSAAPAGSDTQIQFNNSNTLTANSDFRWDYTNKILYVNDYGFGAAPGSGSSNLVISNSDSMTHNTTGSSNIALNYQALSQNTTGSDNVAIGTRAMRDTTTSYQNVAIGNEAMVNSEGNQNVVLGKSVFNSASGDNNLALGGNAMNGSSGNQNIALGGGSLGGVTGNNNIAIGYGANVPSTSGSNQLSIANLIYGASGNVGIGTGSTPPTSTLSFSGTSARTIGMERQTNPFAGNNFTLQAGGAKVGTTDQNGGDLILKAGVATGTGGSNLRFYVSKPSVSSSGDRTPAEAMTLNASGTLDVKGHLSNSGAAASLGTCGSGSSMSGNDTRGYVTMGSGSITTCTINFNAAFGAAPICTVSWRTTASAIGMAVTSTTTALTVTFTGAADSLRFNYHCIE